MKILVNRPTHPIPQCRYNSRSCLLSDRANRKTSSPQRCDLKISQLIAHHPGIREPPAPTRSDPISRCIQRRGLRRVEAV